MLSVYARYCGKATARQAANLAVPFLAMRARELRPNSHQAQFTHLKSFLAWCAQEGHIDRSPLEGMRGPRREETVSVPLSDHEIMALLDAGDLWDRAALILMLATGMRFGELIKLRWEDITADKVLLHGKGRKQRTVAPGAAAMRTLITLPRDGPRVFPYTYDGLQNHLRLLAKRANVRFHPHLLRHTYAHRFMEATGGDIDALSVTLGHQSIETTTVYLRAYRRERALELQRKYNPADELLDDGLPAPHVLENIEGIL